MELLKPNNEDVWNEWLTRKIETKKRKTEDKFGRLKAKLMNSKHKDNQWVCAAVVATYLHQATRSNLVGLGRSHPDETNVLNQYQRMQGGHPLNMASSGIENKLLNEPYRDIIDKAYGKNILALFSPEKVEKHQEGIPRQLSLYKHNGWRQFFVADKLSASAESNPADSKNKNENLLNLFEQSPKIPLDIPADISPRQGQVDMCQAIYNTALEENQMGILCGDAMAYYLTANTNLPMTAGEQTQQQKDLVKFLSEAGFGQIRERASFGFARTTVADWGMDDNKVSTKFTRVSPGLLTPFMASCMARMLCKKDIQVKQPNVLLLALTRIANALLPVLPEEKLTDDLELLVTNSIKINIEKINALQFAWQDADDSHLYQKGLNVLEAICEMGRLWFTMLEVNKPVGFNFNPMKFEGSSYFVDSCIQAGYAAFAVTNNKANEQVTLLNQYFEFITININISMKTKKWLVTNPDKGKTKSLFCGIGEAVQDRTPQTKGHLTIEKGKVKTLTVEQVPYMEYETIILDLTYSPNPELDTLRAIELFGKNRDPKTLCLVTIYSALKLSQLGQDKYQGGQVYVWGGRAVAQELNGVLTEMHRESNNNEYLRSSYFTMMSHAGAYTPFQYTA